MTSSNDRERRHTWTHRLLSRRAFLRQSVLAGAAITAIPGLLAACGDDDEEPDDAADEAADTDTEEPDDSDEADDATDTASGEPQRGGTIRIGMTGSPDTFDPLHVVQWEGIWPQSMLYSRLVRLNHELEPIQDLATDWEAREDGLQWVFTLRDDAVFHNGREVTAEDVANSFNLIVDPEEGAITAGEVSMLDRTEAVDDYEVVLHMRNPYAGFITLAGMYFMRVIPIEEKDNLATDPVGSGPYVVDNHSPGERLVLRRFEDYYNLENEAFAETIEYITLSEETSRLTALTGGTIDIVSEIPPSMLSMVQDVPGVNVDDVETGNYVPICMNVNEDPFTDVRVRQAMKLVLDREQFLDAGFQGQGVLGADHSVPPFDPMDAGLPIPEQDFEGARALLEEAGFSDGLEVTLHTTAGQVGMQESALALQEMAAGAGIEIEVANHPQDAYWSETYMTVAFFVSNWSARPLADQALAVAHFEESGWNETFWHDEEFEELVIEGRSTLDEEERHQLLSEAQELVASEGASIIPFFVSMTGGWSERIQNFHMHPLKWIDMHEVWINE